MSLSKLIKREEKSFFSIKSFKAEEIGGDQKNGSPSNNITRVKLPLRKASSTFPHF